jgi:hypothetical protein
VCGLWNVAVPRCGGAVGYKECRLVFCSLRYIDVRCPSHADFHVGG